MGRDGRTRENRNARTIMKKYEIKVSEVIFKLHFSTLFVNASYRNYLTLKAPRKTASENVVCLCRLLNILADFSNLFLHTGKQCGP